MLNVTIVPVLKDNYSYILACGGDVAIVDPGEPAPLEIRLAELGLTPRFILNTHHHADHIAGNRQLKKAYGCTVLGPAADVKRIPDIDQGLGAQDTVQLGDETLRVIETPGHTEGHICFYAEKSKKLFCGDTLFSMGCGKLLGGSAAQLWSSLQAIASLPDDTEIYCGHEYTQANGQFCQSIEPDNAEIGRRLDMVRKLVANGKPSIPSTLSEEKKTNVFLRARGADDFARLRTLKDNF